MNSNDRGKNYAEFVTDFFSLKVVSKIILVSNEPETAYCAHTSPPPPSNVCSDGSGAICLIIRFISMSNIMFLQIW